MVVFYVIVLCTILGNGVLAGSGKLPPSFKRCARDSENFMDCLKNAAEDAIHQLRTGEPSLGVFPLDPLEVTTLAINKGNGPVNIKLRFDNVKLHGISDSTLNNHRSKVNEYKLTVDAFTPVLRLEADYDMNGRVLVLPIAGKGKCNVTLYELKSTLIQNGEAFMKNGVKYMKDLEFIYKMYPKKVVFKFDNLFNGDPTLGPAMNRFMNENWEVIMNEIKPPLEEGLGQIFLDIANRIFLKVPFDDIFPPTL